MAAPAINPALFAQPAVVQHAPILPTNFWTLLLAPPTESESPDVPAHAITPNAPQTRAPLAPAPVRAASPQQIAQALIRSMLTPVAPKELDIEQLQPETTGDLIVSNKEPEATSVRKAQEKKTPEKELSTPVFRGAIFPIPLTIAPPPNAAPIPTGAEPETIAPSAAAPNQNALSIPAAVAPSNAVSAAPIAFALRLTPVAQEPLQGTSPSEAQPAPAAMLKPVAPVEAHTAFRDPSSEHRESPPSEHPKIQRAETQIFEQKPRELASEPSVPMAKPMQVVAEVPAAVAPREVSPMRTPAVSVPDALAAPPPLETQAKAETSPVPVHELAMRVSTPDSQPVDIRVAERGGEVHVAVRTADTSLQASLQGDLGSLVGKLEQSGFRAEAFVPEARHLAESNAPTHALTTHSTADLSGSGTYGESKDTQGESGGHWTGSDSRHSDQRQQQQQHRRQGRAWEEMMEDMQ